MQNYTHIIWDWNGTLFNDVERCMKTINKMLAKRGIKLLKSIEEYRSAFCFPIIKYYKSLGFNFEKEPFEELAKEFIALYHSDKTGNCRLHEGTEIAFDAIKKAGIKQVILSASEKGNLLSQIREFDIEHYFDEIIGLSDVYAKSKIDAGLDYMLKNKVESALLIGDTEHDYEAALALKADCVLIAGGHQDRGRLQKCGVPVFDDIFNILSYLNGAAV